MKKTSFILWVSLFSAGLFAQDDTEKITNAIVEEGKKLYRSEMASWYGTDIFLEKYKNKSSVAKGYLSYAEGSVTKCIFYSKGEKPKAIVTITFDRTYSTASAVSDDTERDFSQYENSLFNLREAALKDVNNDTLYKVFKNTNLNLIPLIDGENRKVYVLTGSSENGVVVIGNDYLLTFDGNDKLVARRRLHKNANFLYYGSKSEQKVIGGIHTHLPETGDFITATDICTLMLYEKIAGWESHIVVSEKYVCIWNCKTDSLITITREAWEKINNDRKKGNGN